MLSEKHKPAPGGFRAITKVNKGEKMKTKVRVSSGQYEQSTITKVISHETDRGFRRRCRQLSREYAVYGDNWAGWIAASVTIAHPNDTWHKCQVIGGRYCETVNEPLEL